MMNEKDRGLRGMGGTRMLTNYTDVIHMARDCVVDVTEDNKCDFDTNLDLFLEGLRDDINLLVSGEEVRFLPIRPKSQQDVE